MLEPRSFKEEAQQPIDVEAMKHRRRLGRFAIDIDLVRRSPERVADLLMGLVVFRAEARIDNLTVEYSAWSMEFEQVPEGVIPPWYEAIATRNRNESGEESVNVRWVKRDERR